MLNQPASPRICLLGAFRAERVDVARLDCRCQRRSAHTLTRRLAIDPARGLPVTPPANGEARAERPSQGPATRGNPTSEVRWVGNQEGRSPMHTKGSEMISEALATTRATTGFRSRPLLRESQETRAKTRLAVARAKKGDHEALSYLYLNYSPNIYGYVRSIVRDDHEAEDVTQHVFAKLITTLVKYEDRGGPFSPWLLCFARRVAIDHLRANRLTPTEEVLDPTSSFSSDLDQAQTIWTAFAMLPDEQREVVFLRLVVGLTAGEIAERMGRTESSVNAHLHRGRHALCEELRRLDSTPLTVGSREAKAA
jgi:RNA polymerase sigma-70 factor, ECF subfamily